MADRSDAQGAAHRGTRHESQTDHATGVSAGVSPPRLKRLWDDLPCLLINADAPCPCRRPFIGGANRHRIGIGLRVFVGRPLFHDDMAIANRIKIDLWAILCNAEDLWLVLHRNRPVDWPLLVMTDWHWVNRHVFRCPVTPNDGRHRPLRDRIEVPANPVNRLPRAVQVGCPSIPDDHWIVHLRDPERLRYQRLHGTCRHLRVLVRGNRRNRLGREVSPVSRGGPEASPGFLNVGPADEPVNAVPAVIGEAPPRHNLRELQRQFPELPERVNNDLLVADIYRAVPAEEDAGIEHQLVMPRGNHGLDDALYPRRTLDGRFLIGN